MNVPFSDCNCDMKRTMDCNNFIIVEVGWNGSEGKKVKFKKMAEMNIGKCGGGKNGQ